MSMAEIKGSLAGSTIAPGTEGCTESGIQIPFLQEMCDQFHDEFGYQMIFVSERGEIIAAVLRERIGTTHAIGAEIMSGKRDEGIVTEADAAQSDFMKEGVSVGIDVDGTRVAVVGITGPVEKVHPLARLAGMWVIAMVRAENARCAQEEMAEQMITQQREILEQQKEYVQERTRSIQSLLDLSGQGFLSFGADMKVRPEYSRECVEIFGEEIEGHDLSKLLYSDPQEQADFVDALALVFAGDSSPDVVFSLLDASVKIRDKTVELDFRAIDTDYIMCSLRDVSEQQMLEARISEVNELREMLLGVVMNRPHFAALVREADRLFELLNSMTASGEFTGEEENVASAYREIHTFKANASYLKLKRSVDAAHRLEDALAEFDVLTDGTSVLLRIEEMQHAFRKDLFTVKNNLGPEWIAPDETMVIPRLQLEELERQLRSEVSGGGEIADRLQRLQMVPYSTLESRVAGLVQDLASARGKRLKPLEFSGNDFLLDREYYEALSHAVTHIIRNMVDHGIERPRDRERAGKAAEGVVSISSAEQNGHVRIIIEDDGQGIDVQKVKAKAISLNLVQHNSQPSREELLKLIFKQGFSTAAYVTPTSGRGVGLVAVRDEIKRVGGKLSVSTRNGKGTRFEITIPKGSAVRGLHEG
ncbi:MAG: hypothetical protein EA428_01135 [Spirochaetaceae bacterium]|nr:MAG: hypothetical protein EA428_01135 [Spirochaetaceae bacterium]